MQPKPDSTRPAPLQLHKETLRTLLDDELDHVAGGWSLSIMDTGTEYGPGCWCSGGGGSYAGSGSAHNY